MNLYTTPPSILTLVTWVPQSRLAFGHSARRLAIGPPALAKPNPTVCSLAWRWRLRLALRADQESFSIESGPLLDSEAFCWQLRVILLGRFLFWSSLLNILYHLDYWSICNSVHKKNFCFWFSAIFGCVVSFGDVLNPKGPPLWWKIGKIVQKPFLIAQKKRPDALNAMQKTSGHYKVRFWKK